MGRLAKQRQRRQVAKRLAASKPVEDRYVRALVGLMRGIHVAYMRALAPLIKDWELVKSPLPRSDASKGSFTIQNVVGRLHVEIDTLRHAIQPQIRKAVTKAFDPMAKGVATKVDQGLADLTGRKIQGVTLHDIGHTEKVLAAREANVSLLEKAHRIYAAEVRSIFENPEYFGARVEDLTAALVERGNVSVSRAELIARDQTLKMNGAINEIRQTEAGVSTYTWSTSLDERVREEHAALEGETFSWDDPPDVGHPGEDIQCRCVAVPNIDFETIGSDEG